MTPAAQQLAAAMAKLRPDRRRKIKGGAITLTERFKRFVSPEQSSGCCLWTGATNDGGYGVIRDGRQTLRAHRLSWELHKGPIPAGLCVLHRCDIRLCVNPGHLFLGTRGDNAQDRDAKGRLRSGQRAKTHCPQGHPYAGENLYVRPNGWRRCRACDHERKQK